MSATTRQLAQVRHNLGADALIVKRGDRIPAKSRVHKDFADRLKAAMAEKKGWTGRGAATRLARAVRAAPSLAGSWLRGERIPRSPYYGRILDVLGISAGALEGAPNTSGDLQERRTGLGRVSEQGRRPGSQGAATLPPDWEGFVGLVRDALLGAVDRALARDHELEQTRRGYRILGDVFTDLALALADNGVDTHELARVARELQKLGDQ